MGEDEAPQLKDAVCAVLRSADVIALQGADNIRVSCLPCYGEFREKYEWSGYGMPRGFKVMVKVIRTSYLSRPEGQHFSTVSMKYCSGSNIGDSGSFLGIMSLYNFCPDRNMRLPKIPPDQNFGWIRRYLRSGWACGSKYLDD